jgi:hypothetical protein
LFAEAPDLADIFFTFWSDNTATITLAFSPKRLRAQSNIGVFVLSTQIDGAITFGIDLCGIAHTAIVDSCLNTVEIHRACDFYYLGNAVVNLKIGACGV